MVLYRPIHRITLLPSARTRNPPVLTQVHYHTKDLAFDRSWISDAALQVVSGLQEAGFDGYLVGGCVRDLLLHRRPKDFDITTDASPEQVKQLFRRSRIIGRRFKIVHVRFGREIIEVATYRAKPGGARKARAGGVGGAAAGRRPVSESGRVVDDNVFGTIEQDATRRDFTINSLYYDPNRELVMDFLGGVKDARKNALRMIGDARERFTEDPVRMLRALRFRAKLGLVLDGGLEPAIADCLELLEDVPAARLFDEVLKMFHHGHAGKSWDELRDHNLVEKLFPMTAAVIAETDAGGKADEELIEIALKNTDQRVRQGKPVIAAFLFAVLLWRPFRREFDRRSSGTPFNEAVWAAGDRVFARQCSRVAVPRRVSGAVVEIWEMQFWLEARRPRAVPRMLESRRFRAGYDFLTLRRRTGEVDEELVRWWTDIQECGPEQQQRLIESLPAHKTPARRRRKNSRGAGDLSSGANAGNAG